MDYWNNQQIRIEKLQIIFLNGLSEYFEKPTFLGTRSWNFKQVTILPAAATQNKT